ncbi:MAG TPA: polysaccharide pyruvyl transferase family protein [Verrucomicrobiae bacterium]|nr:polysaccharide pyruvyl transferase family protein [Verrucomicrobiae bacterium]
MNERLVLGQFGTFDVENYGDLLYPVLLERMFRLRNDTGEIRKFSLIGSKSLQDSGYDTNPIRQLFSSDLEVPHTLIVGGGDLLRTDWDTVASHYRSIWPKPGGMRPPSKWRRRFTKWFGKPGDADREFRRQHMNYPAVGPFIIEPGGASKIKSVIYCSCGVPFAFDENLKSLIAGVFSKSIFIYVRDYPSKNALIQAGITGEIHTGPDLAVVLSDFFDAAQERAKGRRILGDRGVNPQGRILCFQCCPQSRKKNAEIVTQLKAYRRCAGCEVVLLPLGGCHGDREYLKQLARDSGGAFKYVELNSIFDIIAALAGCDVFLGTSLHGNVTAFSFGIPHLFGPIQVAKREGFLEMANLPPDLKLESWAEINQKLDLATTLGGDFFAARAIAAKRRVHEVFDLLLRTVRSGQAPITAVARHFGG